MAMRFLKGNVSVTCQIGRDGKLYEAFNLSDYHGARSLRSAAFRKLPPEQKSEIKAALAEARAEEQAARDSEVKSAAEIAKVWRDDMIRYEDLGSKPAALVDRTLAGINYVEAKDAAELPTYQDHQFGKSGSVHAYDSRITCYYGQLIDGGIVIDRHDVLDKRPSLSISSPMLDSHIKQVSRFADAIATNDNFMLDALSDPGSFGGLATLAKAATTDKAIGAFDYLPLSQWVAWWKNLGARVGRRVGDNIVWDDGEVDPIRPAESRWAVNGTIVSN